MAAYDSLKSLVQQAIRTNGNNEITGQVLQNVLMAMIDELGGENGYAGVATPSTNPGAPDGKVFYFATEAGTYTHFDGATLSRGIHLLVFNGVTWSHQTLYTIDSEVTSGSNNLITSGAVYNKIINAINALDATVSKSAGADGLSLSLTEVDGKVTNISGSIAPQTYDAYGAASAAQIAAATDATNKVNAAKTQILGDAESDYNTLGKLEDKIQAEASRAAAAESALNTAKANKANTLAGYGINDAYTKTEVNGLVSTPHQNYVTVPTYASLPTTGSADTIYRVSNYNGSTSQVDASVYSEYAWNGSGYTFLRVVSQIGEVFDITVYNSNTKYADLAAALGTNGANVPSSIRRGGMSVKFVQSSDNKYVQYRYMGTAITGNPNPFLDTANWQGVDDVPTAGSDDLIKSRGVRDLTTVKTFGIVPLMQGAIIDADGSVWALESRVCTDFLIVEQESVIKVSSPYAIRTIDKYNSDYSYNSRIVNAASLNTYTLPVGIYRISIFKASDSSASITPSDVEPYTYTNNPKIIKILEGLEEDVDELDTEIGKVVDRLDIVENLDQSVFSVQLVQGYIGPGGELVDLSSRVSTDLFDATDNAVTLTVSGDYAIRTANKYSAIGTPIAQILNVVLLTEYTFEKGYKYRVTFCNKNNTSADINPQGVDPNVEFKKPTPIVSNILQLNEDMDNCQQDIEDIDGYAKNGYYVPGLQQGGIKTDDGSEISASNRVRTVSIKCNEDTNIVVDGNFLFLFVCIYTDSYVGYSSVMTHELLLKKGKTYRLVIQTTDNSNITPDDVKSHIKVCNTSLSDEKESIKSNNIFASIVDGIPVNMEELLQGYLSTEGGIVNLASRVTTGYFGGGLDITMVVDGDYAIRTANKYDEHYGNIAQVITGGVTTRYTFTKGYLYRVTICNKNSTSASITPQEVAGHVKLYYSDSNLKDLQSNVNQINAELDDLKNRMLVEDDFNGNYANSNYRNFSLSNISNGKYNISQGWANCLKMAKVVSFQNFVFEFDVNTITNTEEIVVATEETETIVTAMYGSCAYIDMNNAKMYLLKPSRFNDSYPPSISDKRVETSLTNITSQAKRYKVRFGKKERNVFVEFINYYTGEKVSLTCEDATNSGLAGSGYDKLRIGSMSGGISVNSITGISKTKPDILFVGDSVTDGRNIALTDSWAYKLGTYLTDNFMICARAGGQIQQVLNFLDAWKNIIKPKVVIAAVGVNGGNTNENFDLLLSKINSIGAIPVIATIYNVGSTFGNISETEWNNTNAHIVELSCQHIRFDLATSANPYSPEFKSLNPDYGLADNVHPNAQGSVLLYKRALSDVGNLKDLL